MKAHVEGYLDTRLREIPPREVHALIARLVEIDEFKGWWNGRGDPTRLKHLKPASERSAAASTQIAGTIRERAVMPERVFGRAPRLTAHTTALEAGYAEVLRAVCANHREMPLSNDLIMQCHGRMLRYSHADRHHRGRFKTIADAAAPPRRRLTESFALRPADPDLAPRLLASATAWTNAQVAAAEFHPLLAIASFVLEFLAIRPFADGNGRLSRILTTLLLLRCGYAYVPYASLESIIAEHWTEYYFGLRHSQANAHPPHPDITPWLHAFLEVLQLQARQLRGLCAARPDPNRLSLNQLKVLDLFDAEEEVTNRLVCHELCIPKDTAKQVLNRLVSLNLLSRWGAGRAVRYRKIPSEDHTAAVR